MTDSNLDFVFNLKSQQWDDSSYGSDTDTVFSMFVCTGSDMDSDLSQSSGSEEYKSVNDPIHSLMTLHPLCLAIVDTQQFQRLRNIKQCGPCTFVYPSATHTRFEHSLGVYHMAKQMLDALVKHGANVTEQEQLCVQLAGLCHDLGHGPYSHMWEKYVQRSTNNAWHHEVTSVQILRHLIKQNDLMTKFNEYSLEDKHIDLIEDIILGEPRVYDPEKAFLYEIVANRRSGVDVDRLEYMMRDAYQFGVSVDVDYGRILMGAQVVVGDDKANHVGFRDKLIDSILEMFESRTKMHKKCYQHRVCKKIETMLIDALLEVKDFKIRTDDGSEFMLYECHKNVDAFLKLTDHIFPLIEYSTEPSLEKPRNILKRIMRRQFYTNITKYTITNAPLAKIKECMLNLESELSKTFYFGFITSIISVELCCQGMPLNNICFFTKTGQVNTEEVQLAKDYAMSMKFYNRHSGFTCTEVLVFCKEYDIMDSVIIKIREFIKEAMTKMGF